MLQQWENCNYDLKVLVYDLFCFKLAISVLIMATKTFHLFKGYSLMKIVHSD